MKQTDAENTGGRKRLLPYKWEMLVWLWFAFFLHLVDRQIFNNLLPLIKIDLHVSDVQLGLVASIYTGIIGVGVLMGGYAADVWRRKWIIVLSLVVWSAATLLTGVSTGLITLLVFRGLASGGGEAFYYPSAASLISQIHRTAKATALAIHQSAQYVGIIASFLGGYVGERYGWRSAFYLFGGFGIVLGAVLVFRMCDTPHETPDAPGGTAVSPRPPLGVVVRAILGTPTARILYLALAGHVFVNTGYVTWMPTLLHENFGMSVTLAGFSAVAYHYVFALFGVFVGGRLSDRWASRRRAIRMEFEWLGLLLASPFIFWMGRADGAFTCCLAMGLFGFFRGFYDSNLWTALFDVVEPRFRASAIGLMLAWSFLFGAFAPLIMGWTKGVFGLGASVSALAFVYFTAGALVLVAQRTCFEKDYRGEA